jgi:hypothetical protein
MEFDTVLASHGRQIDEPVSESLFQTYSRFISLMDRAGAELLPKSHLMFHLVQNSIFKGNPRHYSTYIDESYNGVIARVVRSCHRRGWAMAVYRKLQMTEALQQRSCAI